MTTWFARLLLERKACWMDEKVEFLVSVFEQPRAFYTYAEGPFSLVPVSTVSSTVETV